MVKDERLSPRGKGRVGALAHAFFVLAGHSTEPVCRRSTVSRVSYGTPGSRALLLLCTYQGEDRTFMLSHGDLGLCVAMASPCFSDEQRHMLYLLLKIIRLLFVDGRGFITMTLSN